MVGPSSSRWFGSGFLEREPARGSALLHALTEVDDTGYVAVCRALASFDVRDRLAEIAVPVLAVAGSEDTTTPPASLQEIADRVPDGRLEILPGVAHLAPIERPEEVAELILEHCGINPTRRSA
jgi:pimeloyl-ACP methyl ester carboxylesterase